MSLPRLNQKFNLYSQIFDSGGDSTLTLISSNIPCRFSENSKYQLKTDGEYTKNLASLHTDFVVEVERDYIIEINDKYYTVLDVKKQKNLSGNDFFQYVILTKNKNVSL